MFTRLIIIVSAENTPAIPMSIHMLFFWHFRSHQNGQCAGTPSVVLIDYYTRSLKIITLPPPTASRSQLGLLITHWANVGDTPKLLSSFTGKHLSPKQFGHKGHSLESRVWTWIGWTMQLADRPMWSRPFLI